MHFCCSVGVRHSVAGVPCWKGRSLPRYLHSRCSPSVSVLTIPTAPKLLLHFPLLFMISTIWTFDMSPGAMATLVWRIIEWSLWLGLQFCHTLIQINVWFFVILTPKGMSCLMQRLDVQDILLGRIIYWVDCTTANHKQFFMTYEGLKLHWNHYEHNNRHSEQILLTLWFLRRYKTWECYSVAVTFPGFVQYLSIRYQVTGREDWQHWKHHVINFLTKNRCLFCVQYTLSCLPYRGRSGSRSSSSRRRSSSCSSLDVELSGVQVSPEVIMLSVKGRKYNIIPLYPWVSTFT